MNSREFLKAGHWPTLLAAFLYFDMSFMVWILLGPLGVQIAADLKLDPAAKGFMVALPVLAGALLRVVNGALVDRIGPKRAGLIGQVIVIVGLIAFWASGARSYAAVLSLGLVLGVAGASFAVALPLASGIAEIPGAGARPRRRRQSGTVFNVVRGVAAARLIAQCGFKQIVETIETDGRTEQWSQGKCGSHVDLLKFSEWFSPRPEFGIAYSLDRNSPRYFERIVVKFFRPLPATARSTDVRPRRNRSRGA